MAKKGMKRPEPRKHPKNEQPPVPEMKSEVKTPKTKAPPFIHG